MRLKEIILIIIAVLTITSCSSTKKVSEKKVKVKRELSESGDSLYSNIRSILTYAAVADKNEDLQELYREYQNTLIDARKILASDLNYNNEIRKGSNQTIL